MSYIVLGIDPAFKITGYALIDRNSRLIVYGEIKTGKFNQLKEIFDKLQEIITIYKPDFISIEQPFGNMNFKTSLKLSQAQGISVLLAQLNNISYIEAFPSEIRKTILGNGSVDKEKVESFIRDYFDIKDENKKLTNNVFDAILVALFGFKKQHYISN